MMFDHRQSTYLGNLGPVPLYVHPSAIFLVIMVAMWTMGGGISGMLMAITVLLIAIILHEMGHGMMARAFGARDVTITLWAFGGLCMSSRQQNRPIPEMFILAAGPGVSFALMGGAYVLLEYLLWNHTQLVVEGRDYNLLGQFLRATVWWNFILGVFNSLPIFPLDGGQFLYQGMTLARMRRQTIHQTSMVISVLFAIGYIMWVMHGTGGQMTNHVIYSILFIGFLLFNAYSYLKD